MLPIIAIPSIASLFATVTKIAVQIGPMLAKYVPQLIEIANKHLPQIINTAEAISTALNVVRPNETAQELGAKAMKADKKPEDFDDINKYINYLREDIKVDINELDSDNGVSKIVRQAVGASLMIKGISESLNTEVTLPFLKAVSVSGIDTNVIVEMIKTYSKSELKMDDFEKYLDKSLSIDSLDSHSDVLVDAYQEANTTKSATQAEQWMMGLEIQNKPI